jgi:gliding motility-associated-like protein
MRFIISTLFFLLTFVLVNAQTNLVPNSGFEDTISCPNNYGQITRATFWQNSTAGSPDYFNSCNAGFWGVPSNYLGNQNARTGNGYALVVAYCLCTGVSTSAREYIQVPLNNVLLRDETYCVEFYVSLANGQYTEYAVNNLGAYFSDIAVASSSWGPLPYIPQITNSLLNPLTTPGMWTKISGSFKAVGTEQFLTIGNFNDNALSDTVFIKPTAVSLKESDYYIDDVSVIHLDADAGRDTAVCSGGNVILGRPASAGLTYSWQPSTGLSSDTIAQPIASPTVTTTYYLTATLAGGCSKLDTVTVTVVDVNAGSDSTVCEGSSVLIGTPALSGVNYNWFPAVGLNDPAIAQPLSTLSFTTTYTVTASANGCIQTDDVTITVLPYISPTADAGTSSTICAGDTIGIGAAANAGYSYTWFPQSFINDAFSSSPIVFPAQTTLYALTVIDTASNYLCKTTGTDSVLITIDPCPPEIPNVFTPNNDGINDVFEIENLSEGSSVRIYNRWGILVYEQIASSDRSEFNWDGRTTSGEVMSAGTYFYIVQLKNEEVYEGFVELLR